MILRTDQPGRLFAVFILAPYLVHTGFKYKDNTLVFIGIVWILYAEPKQLRKN
jgi:hypothetical protein